MTTRISNQFWTQLWHPTDHSGWNLYLDLPNTYTLQSICDTQFSSHWDILTSFSINTKSIKQFTVCSIFKLSCNIKRLINTILNVIHLYMLTALLMVSWWWMFFPDRSIIVLLICIHIWNILKFKIKHFGSHRVVLFYVLLIFLPLAYIL